MLSKAFSDVSCDSLLNNPPETHTSNECKMQNQPFLINTIRLVFHWRKEKYNAVTGLHTDGIIGGADRSAGCMCYATCKRNCCYYWYHFVLVRYESRCGGLAAWPPRTHCLKYVFLENNFRPRLTALCRRAFVYIKFGNDWEARNYVMDFYHTYLLFCNTF